MSLKGKKLTKEHKIKISIANKGRKLSEENKRNISEGLRNSKNKFPTRFKKGVIGKKTHRWKFGRIVNPLGYILIKCNSHPKLSRNGYMAEHRLKMEASLNNFTLKKWISFAQYGKYPKNCRFLNSSEIIHHINGIKDDNRIRNLLLTKKKNHDTHTIIKIYQKRIRELENKLKKKG